MGQIFEVRMKAAEAKEDALQKIRFETTAQFNKPRKFKDKHLYLKISEQVMGKQSPLFSHEQKALYDPATESFYFPRFEFMSD